MLSSSGHTFFPTTVTVSYQSNICKNSNIKIKVLTFTKTQQPFVVLLCTLLDSFYWFVTSFQISKGKWKRVRQNLLSSCRSLWSNWGESGWTGSNFRGRWDTQKSKLTVSNVNATLAHIAKLSNQLMAIFILLILPKILRIGFLRNGTTLTDASSVYYKDWHSLKCQGIVTSKRDFQQIVFRKLFIARSGAFILCIHTIWDVLCKEWVIL